MNLPRFRGDQQLNAKDLNKILDELGRLSRIVGVSPLAVDNDPSGIRIRLQPRRTKCRAIVTQAITPPTSATATHTAANGWGFAQRQRYDKTLNKFVDLPEGPDLIINPWPQSTTTATVGKVIWVEYDEIDDVWQMSGENCT